MVIPESPTLESLDREYSILATKYGDVCWRLQEVADRHTALCDERQRLESEIRALQTQKVMLAHSIAAAANKKAAEPSDGAQIWAQQLERNEQLRGAPPADPQNTKGYWKER